jgi:hypothetical protein
VSILYSTEAKNFSSFRRQDNALHSVNTWENDPPNPLAIFLPALAILLRTPFFIPPTAMNQQNCHENGISPRQQMRESTRSTHGIGQDEIAEVIHVSREAPPSRAQKQGVVLQSIVRSILNA